MKKYILAIDQGTTGTTAIIIDKSTNIVSKATIEFKQIYPSPGYVEHNPLDIWKSVKKAIAICLQAGKIEPNEIQSIGITNQRETITAWDKITGKPYHNSIVWQCRRTSDMCKKLKNEGLEESFHIKTGLYLDPYFSGTKIKWLLENLKLKNYNNLYCGTIDSFLIYKLTGGKSFFTEPSNASRTLLYNINTLKWDTELCNILNIPLSILPEVKESSSFFGETKGLDFLPDGIPIQACLGDQQAALFGQLCFNKGNLKCTYGTGAFLLMNTGEKLVFSKNSLLSTIAWKIDENVTYALEGSVFIAGAAVSWLRDGLKAIKNASDIEKLASKVKSSETVCFVPALTGLGAPHWNPYAKGIITGLTRGTTINHIARAALEGIAFQTHDLIRAMEKDLNYKIDVLKVDGGASLNNILLQFQANILNTQISRPKFIETTALGSGFLAGINSEFWSSKEEIESLANEHIEYSPEKDFSSSTHLEKWEKGIKACLSFDYS